MEAVNECASDSLPYLVASALALSVRYGSQTLGKVFFIDSRLSNVCFSSSYVIVSAFADFDDWVENSVGKFNLISYVLRYLSG